MGLNIPNCPHCDIKLEYQPSELDVGLGECYFCPECDYVIPDYEFPEYDDRL